MKKNSLSSALLVAICFASFGSALLVAQEAPEFPKPQKEHEWLHKFVGEWETQSEMPAGPDQPAMKCKGSMQARMLGGFWLVSESQADAAGMHMNALQTIGYDPQKKKYVGTWVDSMINHMWQYEGTVDKSGKKLTLEAEGPNFMSGGKITKFRDAYEFKTDDHIVVTSSMLGEDGKWVTFMTGTAKRKQSPGAEPRP